MMAAFMESNAGWEPWLVGKVKYLVRPETIARSMEAGIWRGTRADMPPATSVTYKRDEFIFIISGRVRFHMENGEARELGPGEGAHFSAGDRVSWTLLTDDFEEFYVFMPR